MQYIAYADGRSFSTDRLRRIVQFITSLIKITSKCNRLTPGHERAQEMITERFIAKKMVQINQKGFLVRVKKRLQRGH